MLSYLLRRFVSGLVVLFIFISLVFFAVQIALPGDFVSHFAMAMSIDQMEALRHELGLDLPIWQRYLNWVAGLLRGDLGHSYSLAGNQGVPITEILKSIVPPTILVFGFGTGIAFLIGLWLGKITGWHGPGFITGTLTFASISLYTMFPPWMAFLLLYFLITRLRIFSIELNRMLWRDAPVTSGAVMTEMVKWEIIILVGLVILTTLLKRLTRRSLPAFVIILVSIPLWVGTWRWLEIYPYALDTVRIAALPLIAYVLLSFGEITLLMRTTMADQLHEQFVLTARAKGLPDGKVRDRHVVRNALLPVLSGMVIRLPYLLTGAVMIEFSLHWE